MLTIHPTKNLIGVTIRGDYNDLSELVDSIHRMTGSLEEEPRFYYGVKIRLLGLCYDVRHAYMGDRDIVLEENGMSPEIMKWHNRITPSQNVYYSVNVLFPEAIFVAASAPRLYLLGDRYYGMRGKDPEEADEPAFLYADFIRDQANLEVLCAGIWQALGEVIGDEELEKIVRLMERTNESYIDYVTHYIDRCNLELIKTEVEKRKDKLRNITKRIIQKPKTYKNMERDLRFWAKEYKTSIYDLDDPALEYPEDIDW